MSYDRSDIKLSFAKDNVKFFVNEKKKTVHCKISAHMKAPFDWQSNLRGIDDESFIGEGFAVCSDCDNFDVERGKRIALARAENDAYSKAGANLCEYLEEMSTLTMFILNFLDKKNRHEEHNLDYINSLHDPEHPMYKEVIGKIKSGTTNGKPNYNFED